MENGSKEQSQRLTPKQKKFLEIFNTKTAANISATCSAMKISRQAYYKWMTAEPFRRAIEDAQEKLIDMAETKLQQNIMEGKESSIFFFLKTKGKKRGYIETVEQNVKVNPFEALLKSLPDEE